MKNNTTIEELERKIKHLKEKNKELARENKKLKEKTSTKKTKRKNTSSKKGEDLVRKYLAENRRLEKQGRIKIKIDTIAEECNVSRRHVLKLKKEYLELEELFKEKENLPTISEKLDIPITRVRKLYSKWSKDTTQNQLYF